MLSGLRVWGLGEGGADGKQILYTIYSPAEHNSTTIHHTKEEGDEEEENGKDEAPEWATKTKKQNKESGAVKESGKY